MKGSTQGLCSGLALLALQGLGCSSGREATDAGAMPSPNAAHTPSTANADGGAVPDAGVARGLDAATADASTNAALDAAVDAAPFTCQTRDLSDANELAAMSGSGDRAFARAFSTARQACDERLGWSCGFYFVDLDGEGCVVALHGDLQGGEAGDAPVFACLLDELATACSRCEASETRFFYWSCTID